MFNRRQIMTAAWERCRRFGQPFAQCLRLAWYEAKKELPVHKVFGLSIHSGQRTLIAAGLTYQQAIRVEQLNQCRFDRVWTAA